MMYMFVNFITVDKIESSDVYTLWLHKATIALVALCLLTIAVLFVERIVL